MRGLISMRGSLRHAGVAGAILLLAGVSACGGSTGTASSGASGGASADASSGGPAPVQPALAAPAASCTPGATASYQPPAGILTSWPSGSLMQTIKDRGYLVVGVSGDTRLLGARNVLSAGALEGFDIDIAKRVAKALLGSESKVQFRVITAGQRIPLVNSGAGTKAAPQNGVDMVARAMTMTCDRWNNADPAKRVAFSSVYLLAHQGLLVRRDANVASVADLQKQKANVCAPTGSTSLTNIAKFTGIRPVSVEIHSDCLALWQEGKVDAITGDDAILAGFKAQDPQAVILPKVSLEDEPYGLAVAASHREFAQYLNALLEQLRADGTWATVYSTWLAGPLGPAGPPAATYGR
jgi:polar amino acid transport system substrate-binding protein